MKIIGLTGGIASGKTTITKLLKRKKLAVHDSDFVVRRLYSKTKKNLLRFFFRVKN